MEYKVNGIILAREVINDFDLKVTIYTLEKGKLIGLFKRAKKKPAIMAGLEIFNENIFLLSPRKTWEEIYSFDPQKIFLSFRTDYNNYKTACYFSEIIQEITLLGDPNQELYRLLFNVLSLLDHGQNPRNVREYFQINTLKIEGLISAEQTSISETEFKKILSEYTGRNNGGKFAAGKTKISRSAKK